MSDIKAARAKRPGLKKNGFAETTRFLLIVFLFALILRSFIAAPFVIPSGSMLPRMMIGDFLFVAKWPYGYSRFSMPFGLGRFQGRVLEGQPERGDVVVFRYLGGRDDYVKRVIGLPGDRVQVREGMLWLNKKQVHRVRIANFLVPVSPNSPCRAAGGGSQEPVSFAQLERPQCVYSQYRETLPGGRSYHVLDQIDGPGDDTPEYIVPPGNYFVMGDNRDDSQDSRFPPEQGGVGFLPADRLIGRALITFFSTDGSAEWAKPWTWFSAARWERIGETF